MCSRDGRHCGASLRLLADFRQRDPARFYRTLAADTAARSAICNTHSEPPLAVYAARRWRRAYFAMAFDAGVGCTEPDPDEMMPPDLRLPASPGMFVQCQAWHQQPADGLWCR